MSGFWDAAKPLMEKIRWSSSDEAHWIANANYRRKRTENQFWNRKLADRYQYNASQCRQHKIRYQKKLARLMKRHGIPGPDPVSLNERPRKCRKIGTLYPRKKDSKPVS